MHVVINAIHAKTGGGLVYLNNILPTLAQQADLQLTVVCHRAYRDRLTIPDGVAIHEVSYPDRFAITHLWEQLVFPFVARRLGADVTLHIANYASLAAPRPVVLLTNNPEVRLYQSGLKQKLYWHVLIWLTRLSMWRAPVVLSNGDYLKTIYATGSLKFLQDKVISTPSGCGFTLPPGPQPRVDGQLLAVGDLYRHKDYPSLVRSLAKVRQSHPQARLVIVGRDVDAAESARVRGLIDHLGLADIITFTGAVPHEELHEYYLTSHLYISPSCAETFSLTLLEAMACGLPAIVKDCAFQREVAGDDGACYIPFYNDQAREMKTAEALAEAITTLLDDPELAETYRKRGLELASRFTWAATANAIAGALGDAVKK